MSYSVTLGRNPIHENKSYLGVYIQQNTEINQSFEKKYGSWLAVLIIWFIGLFYWLYVLNLGIGLFNLVPLGPIDGGRMLLAVLKKKYPEQKALSIWKAVSSFFLMIILINLVFAFLR
jgi:membrane-associated protease RseP (regulator of RpoE activity)